MSKGFDLLNKPPAVNSERLLFVQTLEALNTDPADLFQSEAAAGTDKEQVCCFRSPVCVERTRTEVEKKGQKVNAAV